RFLRTRARPRPRARRHRARTSRAPSGVRRSRRGSPSTSRGSPARSAGARRTRARTRESGAYLWVLPGSGGGQRAGRRGRHRGTGSLVSPEDGQVTEELAPLALGIVRAKLLDRLWQRHAALVERLLQHEEVRERQTADALEPDLVQPGIDLDLASA